MEQTELRKHFNALRGGDREAFAVIYNDMKTPVYTVIYRIVRRRECAEDVMQEVFVRLFTSPPDDSVKNLRSWIFTMAHNLALDSLRKKQSEPLEDGNTDAAEPPLEHSVGLRLDVESALRRLSSEESRIVTLHLNAGLTFREISSVTGISPSAVYRLYKKAVSALRAELSCPQ